MAGSTSAADTRCGEAGVITDGPCDARDRVTGEEGLETVPPVVPPGTGAVLPAPADVAVVVAVVAIAAMVVGALGVLMPPLPYGLLSPKAVVVSLLATSSIAALLAKKRLIMREIDVAP